MSVAGVGKMFLKSGLFIIYVKCQSPCFEGVANINILYLFINDIARNFIIQKVFCWYSLFFYLCKTKVEMKLTQN